MRRIAIITGSILVAGLTAVGASPALAEGTEGAAQAEQTSADAAKSRRVCRMITPTGSRLALRSCRTKAEWDALTLQSQRGADEQRRNDETVRPGAFTSAF